MRCTFSVRKGKSREGFLQGRKIGGKDFQQGRKGALKGKGFKLGREEGSVEWERTGDGKER